MGTEYKMHKRRWVRNDKSGKLGKTYRGPLFQKSCRGIPETPYLIRIGVRQGVAGSRFYFKKGRGEYEYSPIREYSWP